MWNLTRNSHRQYSQLTGAWKLGLLTLWEIQNNWGRQTRSTNSTFIVQKSQPGNLDQISICWSRVLLPTNPVIGASICQTALNLLSLVTSLVGRGCREEQSRRWGIAATNARRRRDARASGGQRRDARRLLRPGSLMDGQGKSNPTWRKTTEKFRMFLGHREILFAPSIPKCVHSGNSCCSHVCVCVCVCVRERERERECVCVCVFVCSSKKILLEKCALIETGNMSNCNQCQWSFTSSTQSVSCSTSKFKCHRGNTCDRLGCFVATWQETSFVLRWLLLAFVLWMNSVHHWLLTEWQKCRRETLI